MAPPVVPPESRQGLLDRSGQLPGPVGFDQHPLDRQSGGIGAGHDVAVTRAEDDGDVAADGTQGIDQGGFCITGDTSGAGGASA